MNTSMQNVLLEAAKARFQRVLAAETYLKKGDLGLVWLFEKCSF